MEHKRQIDGVYGSRPVPVTAGTVPAARPHESSSKSKGHTRTRSSIFIVLLVLAAAGLILGLHRMAGSGTSPVPHSIQHAVSFSVYYPDAKELPAGYSLDTKSFRLAQPGVVLFAVTYAGNKDIIFSEQQASGSDINRFVSSYIPINSTEQLALGQVRIGAYGSAPDIRTVASLPIHGTWLIVTAPSDVSQDDLVRILQSLTR